MSKFFVPMYFRYSRERPDSHTNFAGKAVYGPYENDVELKEGQQAYLLKNGLKEAEFLVFTGKVVVAKVE